jgi:hypothetical protein
VSDNRDEVLDAALDRLDSTAPLAEQVVQFEEFAETLQARLAEPVEQTPSSAE